MNGGHKHGKRKKVGFAGFFSERSPGAADAGDGIYDKRIPAKGRYFLL